MRGLRLSSLLRMMLTDRQVEIVSRIQALMSVVEGYSNHAMHGTGEYLIPDYQTLAYRMKLREKSRGVGFRVISRLLGLDLKLEQYVIGENFVDHVVRERGIEFVNRVWESPEQLPSLEEVRAPERWIQRVGGRLTAGCAGQRATGAAIPNRSELPCEHHILAALPAPARSPAR